MRISWTRVAGRAGALGLALALTLTLQAPVTQGAPPAPAPAAPASTGDELDPDGGAIMQPDVSEQEPVEPPVRTLSESPTRTTSELPDGLGTATAYGTAVTSSAVTGVSLDDDGAWVATRSAVPAALYRWDAATDRVTGVHDLPLGTGAWAVSATGDDVVVGTFSPGGLTTFSPETGEYGSTARLGDQEIVMGLAPLPDGRLAVGTYDPAGARLLAYDPATGDVEVLRTWSDHRYVRSVAVAGETIYAGLGTPAALWAVGPDGSAAQVDTSALEDESMVYSLTSDGERVYGGTEPGGLLFTVAGADTDPETDTGEAVRVLDETGAKTIDTVAVDGASIWYTSRPDGALRHLDLSQNDAGSEVVTVPRAGAETRDLAVRDGEPVGLTGTSEAWAWNGEQVRRSNLVAVGAPTGPDRAAQGVEIQGDDLIVAGHWRLERHSADRAESDVIPLPGESKATLVHDDVLYSAVYPGAQIQKLEPGAERTEFLARVPNEQMRPRDMIWREDEGDLLVSTRPAYGRWGGDLNAVDPATGEVTTWQRPFGDHTATALLDWGPDVIVGTETYGEAEGTAPGAGPAALLRWTPGDGSGTVQWRTEIDPAAEMITSVAPVEIGRLTYLLASTNSGVVALVHPDTGDLVWSEDLGGSVDQMTTSGPRTVARVDGRLHELQPSLSGLDRVRLSDSSVRWTRLDPQDPERIAAVSPTAGGEPLLWDARLASAPIPQRTGGENRFETAVDVSRTSFGNADTVVVVRYDDFADALAAGPLAAQLDAPILYVRPGSLPPETRAEIERLGAERVVVVGGDGVIGPAVESSLRGLNGGISTERLAGDDRYGTALEVSAEVLANGAGRAPLFVVTGLDFPDGLSAAPAAAQSEGAVVLSQGGALPSEVRSTLSTHPGPIVAVGGPAAASLSAAGIPATTLSGDDRYTTATSVAREYFGGAEDAYLVNGLTFADAMVAGPPAGIAGAPILLTYASVLQPDTAAQLQRAGTDRVLAIGEWGAVSDEVLRVVRRPGV